MTDVVNMRRESIDLKALLLSRTYLYTLFHKLFGGTPDAAVVACVLSETTRDVVEEYAGDDPSMKGLGRFLENLGECVDGAVLTEQARDEYTRLFIGPGELPCQPMESPYRTKDAAVFQENTLAVRAIFREHGLQLARLMRIPDDHMSCLCCLIDDTDCIGSFWIFPENNAVGNDLHRNVVQHQCEQCLIGIPVCLEYCRDHSPDHAANGTCNKHYDQKQNR